MGARNDEAEFSLLRGGAVYELQRRLGLIPARGDGALRRIVCFVALTWLPVALGALATGRAFGSAVPEPLLSHYGIHARLLIAVPLFVVAEQVAEGVVPRLIAQFFRSGLVSQELEPAFRDALGAVARLRDSRLAALVALGAVASSVIAGFAPAANHEIAWAAAGGPVATAAGRWYLFVSRPFFAAFAALWLWRVALLFALFRRIARLELRLVAGHPDRSAGIGFLDLLPLVLVPVVLGLGTVLAGFVAHEVVHHGGEPRALQEIVAAWLALSLALFLLPLLPFVRPLVKLRRRALLHYGALVGRQRRQFERRWVERDPRSADEAAVGVQDISVAADANDVHQVVEEMRPFPLGVRDLVPLAVASLLPFVPVAVIDVPLKNLMLRILSALA